MSIDVCNGMVCMMVEVPEGVKVQVDGNEVTTTGSLGSNSRRFNPNLLTVKQGSAGIEIEPIRSGALAPKAEKAVNAFARELRNDMQGVGEHFERRMSIVFAHFPMTVEAKGDEFLIRNMFGERSTRRARIVGSTKVEVKGQSVRVYGTSKDDVTQTAANIRKATKTRRRDIRIFQDGIYYTLEQQ